jgi:hypothetical protein
VNKDDKKKKDDKGKDAKDANKGAQPDIPSNDEYKEEKDPLQPDIELDDVCEILKEFLDKREEKLNNQDLIGGNPALKKKSNF